MSILDTIKSIADITKQINDIELKSKIIDLQNEVYQLIEENHKLRIEKESGDEKVRLRESLVFEDNSYYLNKNNNLVGPYCSPCFDASDNLVRLHEGSYGWLCPICIKKK